MHASFLSSPILRFQLHRWTRRTALLSLCCALAACAKPSEPWHLTDVSGHLPDLDFSLIDDSGAPVTGHSFEGRTTLVYFGYTHCPDVCPETMARLMQVLQRVGADADRTRIVFISVDPARDTPALLRSYVRAFDDKHAVGLTGTERAIETVAQRYRVAYQMEKRDPSGAYEVTHSSAVYIFDAAGHARLLATDHDSVEAIAADLKRVIHAKDA
ncbi:electron transport protein SCO1/SenC [Caballeronia hypogeia]|uniref:Electron transport protein SCO1/SenC n=1 Tax=Caballeronia hypogeia TaxID=1777140 RepID=A0A158B3A8_9BURK|nr:SCO family protein [Caballeronia hypogeia]SAK63787.1 electron transport protein SCO1/SenC [Caballeronia hypogeia]